MAVQVPDVGTITRNPLEPLSADEIRRVSEIAREQRDIGPQVRFVTIALHEPPKQDVLEHDRTGGPAPDRVAFAVLYDRGHQQTVEALVSLSNGVVTSWQIVEDVQPSVMLEEFFSSEEITRADPRWQEAMRKRGVTDFSLTMIDPWAAGYDIDDPRGRRLVRPLTFVRSREDDNGYARPVEGLIVLFDLDLMEVVDVRDHGVVPLPEKAGNYVPELMSDDDNRPAFTGLRDDVRPIEITQPEGPSFTVDGHAVSWQKWRLRVGYTPREGLVLHQVGYEERGRLRPVIFRASLSEMYIPYGDPAPTHRIKNVFDEGEYGVGLMLNPLTLGCDCLGEIHYFDVTANDQDGQPVTIPNAICMHEEDFGVGWKHTDFRTEKVEVRRSRRLVISCFATIGNYEYGFFWYLYTDGTIQYEVKLSGVLSTGAVPVGEEPRHGVLVAPGLYGPHHQHFFNVRLDMQVDGERNSVYEVDAAALPPGPDNPYGNAWVTKKMLLARESEAQRLIDPLIARSWYITNPSAINELGQPTCYKLMPGDNVLPLQQEGSQAFARAQFAYKHLWVTAFDPDERYAAGDYPNQHGSPGGLVEYQRPTARSRTTTSWSGTPSAPTTWCGRRTGRSCRSVTSGSCSSRSASSTATRHWTCRARRPPATRATATATAMPTAMPATTRAGRCRSERPGDRAARRPLRHGARPRLDGPGRGPGPVRGRHGTQRGHGHDAGADRDLRRAGSVAVLRGRDNRRRPGRPVRGAVRTAVCLVRVVVQLRRPGPRADRRVRGRLGAVHRLHVHRHDRVHRHRHLLRELPHHAGTAGELDPLGGHPARGHCDRGSGLRLRRHQDLDAPGARPGGRLGDGRPGRPRHRPDPERRVAPARTSSRSRAPRSTA